jgi:hypothetical protein
MRKKTQQDFIKWIKECVDYYAPILGIGLQQIKIQYGEKTTFLEITCTYPYLDPTIRFSNDAFQDWSKGEMKKDRVLHELCHIITDPLYSKAQDRYIGKNEVEDERERLTDTIAMIVRGLDEK